MQLGYCEIYKPNHHGILLNNEYGDKKYIYTSLLFQYSLSLSEFYDTSINSARKEWEERGPWQISLTSSNSNNPFIRNSKAIKLNNLEILKIIKYEDYEFCIIKTLWLKILQRKFKKYYKKHFLKRINMKNILNRSTIGKWDY